MTLMLLAPPTRCRRRHCGGVIIRSETGIRCLLCGRSPLSPPEPLPLVQGSRPRCRLGEGEPLREELLGLLAPSPLPRDAIYDAIGGKPSTINRLLKGLRHEGLLLCERQRGQGSVWRLAATEEPPNHDLAAQDGQGPLPALEADAKHGSAMVGGSGMAQAGPLRQRRFGEVPAR